MHRTHVEGGHVGGIQAARDALVERRHELGDPEDGIASAAGRGSVCALAQELDMERVLAGHGDAFVDADGARGKARPAVPGEHDIGSIVLEEAFLQHRHGPARRAVRHLLGGLEDEADTSGRQR